MSNTIYRANWSIWLENVASSHQVNHHHNKKDIPKEEAEEGEHLVAEEGTTGVN
ncbi:hypothetical protein C0J52_28279 [Blattella germanica]|nr:hypothetical protein C0J52_28279 [Blattella germanica]